jgi:hypothetical protein
LDFALAYFPRSQVLHVIADECLRIEGIADIVDISAAIGISSFASREIIDLLPEDAALALQNIYCPKWRQILLHCNMRRFVT